MAAGRAWMPSLFTTTISFFTLRLSPDFFAALINFVETSPTRRIEANSFSKRLVLLHFGNQHIVQLLGWIMSRKFELGLKRRHLDETRQIAPGPDGNNHVRNVNTKN